MFMGQISISNVSVSGSEIREKKWDKIQDMGQNSGSDPVSSLSTSIKDMKATLQMHL